MLCRKIYKTKNTFLALLLALCMLLCLMLSACGNSEVHIETIRIWYLKGDYFASWLDGYAGDFHSREMRLELTGFDSENELAAALDAERPELLLCSGRKAFGLYEREKLNSSAVTLSSAPEFISQLSDIGGVGTAFFPLGLESLVLIRGSAAKADTYKSLEDFIAAAEKYSSEKQKPYFAISSYSEYFYSYMEQYGEHFSGQRENDIQSKKYVSLYNLLAEAFFAGAMDISDSPAKDVSSGALPCALVRSSMLAAIDMVGVSVQAIPPAKGRGALSWAQVYGLAVTAEGESKSRFISQVISGMLSDSGLSQACFDCGCFPAQAADGEPSGALAAALYAVRASLNISIPQSGSGYYACKSSFDEDFTTAMELLGHGD